MPFFLLEPSAIVACSVDPDLAADLEILLSSTPKSAVNALTISTLGVLQTVKK